MNESTNAEKPVSTKKKAARKKTAVKKAAKPATPATETLPDPDQLVYEQPHEIPASEADPELVAEENRRRNIRDEMERNAGTIESLMDQVDQLKQRNETLLFELYPQAAASDSFQTAVRGFVKASIADRQNRAAQATDPVRLAALIDTLQKAPIDRAMTRRTARGTARPKHPTKQVKSEG